MKLKQEREKGEPLVWLTGLGLAVGLLMIFTILAVIVYEGVGVFWPKNMVEAKMKDGKRAQSIQILLR